MEEVLEMRKWDVRASEGVVGVKGGQGRRGAGGVGRAGMRGREGGRRIVSEGGIRRCCFGVEVWSRKGYGGQYSIE